MIRRGEFHKIFDKPEVPTRRQARPSHHRRVEPRALAFDKPIEVVGIQQCTQPSVERMSRRLWQLRARHPQRPLLTLSGSHRHATHCSFVNRFWRSFQSSLTFTTGCSGPWPWPNVLETLCRRPDSLDCHEISQHPCRARKRMRSAKDSSGPFGGSASIGLFH